MSSENDMSINVCLLGKVKAGDLLGVGVQGHQFNFQSLMLLNLLGLHAIGLRLETSLWIIFIG